MILQAANRIADISLSKIRQAEKWKETKMGKRIAKRLAVALFTMYAVITISFLMVRFMPGDPLIHLVGQENYYDMLKDSPAALELIAQKYGLSGSIGEQYIHYLRSIVTLDFGIAYSNKQPVLNNVIYRAGWTLILSIPTFLLGGLFGAILGMLAGWRPGGRFDKITKICPSLALYVVI